MNLKSLICRVTLGIRIVSAGTMVSCESFKEDLPECRLSVKFKYDYNMEFADAFHTQVDKVCRKALYPAIVLKPSSSSSGFFGSA